MNWITRCPECATVYQVTPEQSQLAKGWLRCGQCQHVFDSTGLVLAWSGSRVAVLPRLSDAADIAHPRTDGLSKQEDHVAASTHSKASMDLVAFEDALSSFKPELEKTIAELSFAPLMISDPGPLDESTGIQSPDSAALERRRPSVLWGWLLLLVLSVQWLWIERHALIVRWPAIELPFKAVCQAIACQSEYLRDVNAMVIDSSSFIQREDGYQLEWTIRNSSEQVVLMTALELTLLDVKGQAVLRRVLFPVDVGAAAILMPGQTWAGQLLMHVDSAIPVVGYRLLSFYP
jgi:predicted Zn finger-like uncharacterized protein